MKYLKHNHLELLSYRLFIQLVCQHKDLSRDCWEVSSKHGSICGL